MEIDPSDILTMVSPSTATGRTYSLTSQKIIAATRALEARTSTYRGGGLATARFSHLATTKNYRDSLGVGGVLIDLLW